VVFCNFKHRACELNWKIIWKLERRIPGSAQLQQSGLALFWPSSMSIWPEATLAQPGPWSTLFQCSLTHASRETLCQPCSQFKQHQRAHARLPDHVPRFFPVPTTPSLRSDRATSKPCCSDRSAPKPPAPRAYPCRPAVIAQCLSPTTYPSPLP
jgi:hypothetical protein